MLVLFLVDCDPSPLFPKAARSGKGKEDSPMIPPPGEEAGGEGKRRRLLAVALFCYTRPGSITPGGVPWSIRPASPPKTSSSVDCAKSDSRSMG